MVNVSEEVATPPPSALWSSVAMAASWQPAGDPESAQAVMTALPVASTTSTVVMAITPARARGVLRGRRCAGRRTR